MDQHYLLNENNNVPTKPHFMKREADEFSFAAEHIEDEPSIHIKSLTEFQSILSKK